MSIHIDTIDGRIEEPERNAPRETAEAQPKPPPRERPAVEWKRMNRRTERLRAD